GVEEELDPGGVDPEGLRRILVALDRSDAIPDPTVGNPICQDDLDGEDDPDRVEPRERLKSDVQDDALAVAELLDLKDDVRSCDGDDEGRDGEVHAPAPQDGNAEPHGDPRAR